MRAWGDRPYASYKMSNLLRTKPRPMIFNPHGKGSPMKTAFVALAALIMSAPAIAQHAEQASGRYLSEAVQSTAETDDFAIIVFVGDDTTRSGERISSFISERLAEANGTDLPIVRFHGRNEADSPTAVIFAVRGHIMFADPMNVEQALDSLPEALIRYRAATLQMKVQ